MIRQSKYQKKVAGSALIITITCLIVLVTMVAAMVTLMSYHYSYQQTQVLTKQAQNLATESAERFRSELYLNFKSSKLSLTNWLTSTRTALSSGTTAGCRKEYPKTYNIPYYNQGDSAVNGTIPCTAWVDGMSADGASDTWIEIIGRAGVGKGVFVQVKMRVAFGQPNLFDLCVLTTTTNCMCCHLIINGDVGTLGDFRPGFNDESSSKSGSVSGADSYIYGNLYSAGDFQSSNSSLLKYPLKQSDDSNFDDYYLTKDYSNLSLVDSSNLYDIQRTDSTCPFELNGLQVYGDPNTTSDKIGDKLPDDTDNDQVRNFPTIDFDDAKKNATGSISTTASDSTIYGVPMSSSSTYTSGKVDLSGSGISKTYDGHLVLIGTESNPIKLSGDIVVSGDVVIKGYFTGQGTIYSGRNVYIAGDIVTVNSPTNYQSLTTETARDAQAVADIQSGKDAVRLAAKNTVVIGDYVYESQAVRDKQSALFYAQQFNLDSGDTGYFKKDSTSSAYSGVELTKNSDGTYSADDGTTVSSSNVVTVTGTTYYDYVITPVVMKADGTTTKWMSDSEYRTLLGDTDAKTNYTWRGDVSTEAELIANGFTSAQAKSILKNSNNSTSTTDGYNYTRNGNNMRVIYPEATYYIPYQVGRVDAYLYATNRIAGMTIGKNLVISGGLIAKEIGILAPGHRYNEEDGWMPTRYKTSSATSVSFPDKNATNSTKYPNSALNGKYGYMTVNYDYRMRNGGQGFPLIRGGTMGKRIYWTYSSSAN